MSPQSASRFLLEPADATALADAVCALEGVHHLYPGHYGEIALLFPGHKIAGIKAYSPQDDSHLQVYVVVDTSAQPNLAQLGESIRTTALHLIPRPQRVDVIFSSAVSPRCNSFR